MSSSCTHGQLQPWTIVTRGLNCSEMTFFIAAREDPGDPACVPSPCSCRTWPPQGFQCLETTCVTTTIPAHPELPSDMIGFVEDCFGVPKRVFGARPGCHNYADSASTFASCLSPSSFSGISFRVYDTIPSCAFSPTIDCNVPSAQCTSSPDLRCGDFYSSLCSNAAQMSTTTSSSATTKPSLASRTSSTGIMYLVFTIAFVMVHFCNGAFL